MSAAKPVRAEICSAVYFRELRLQTPQVFNPKLATDLQSTEERRVADNRIDLGPVAKQRVGAHDVLFEVIERQGRINVKLHLTNDGRRDLFAFVKRDLLRDVQGHLRKFDREWVDVDPKKVCGLDADGPRNHGFALCLRGRKLADARQEFGV